MMPKKNSTAEQDAWPWAQHVAPHAKQPEVRSHTDADYAENTWLTARDRGSSTETLPWSRLVQGQKQLVQV